MGLTPQGRKAGAGMPGQPYNPLHIFAAAFSVACFAGLAALLRSHKHLDRLTVFSAMLNSGLLGLAISLIWYTNFKHSEDEIYIMIGICVLAGLAGTTTLDFILQLCKRGGLAITIKANDEDKDLPSAGD
jgi:hypothetical protein